MKLKENIEKAIQFIENKSKIKKHLFGVETVDNFKFPIISNIDFENIKKNFNMTELSLKEFYENEFFLLDEKFIKFQNDVQDLNDKKVFGNTTDFLILKATDGYERVYIVFIKNGIKYTYKYILTN